MTKLSIVGRGTAGCLSMVYWRYWLPREIEIDWVYDSNTPTTLVGEGTDLTVPALLVDSLGYSWNDLIRMNGTPKIGIKKENWSGENFMHSFSMGHTGIHIDSSKLQAEIFKEAGETGTVNLIDKRIESPDELDSDFVMMVSGTPKDWSDYTMIDIPVNSVYVTQCYWDSPQFDYTLTIARPWGWVFGIPLQHRCSIGYMYNSDYCTLEEVQEDVKEVFAQYGLTPSDTTNQFSFKNYKRNKLIDGRVAYNGNAGFFLEPLEATSLYTVAQINNDLLSQMRLVEPFRAEKALKGIELLILIHYMNGSKFKTPFWDMAQDVANRGISKLMKEDWIADYINALGNGQELGTLGSWQTRSWMTNMEKLGVKL